MENINFDSLKRRRDLRIILPVFLVSIIACIDRVNISYAKLTMTQTLSWLSPEVYGFGAGIFFAGYLLLEIRVPSLPLSSRHRNGFPASCSPGALSASAWPSSRRNGISTSAASSWALQKPVSIRSSILSCSPLVHGS